MQAAQQSGLTLQKEWLATGDSHTRLTHMEADGQTVGMDEPFIVGGAELQYPGDPDGPSQEVVMCRCTQVYMQAADASSGDTTGIIDDGSVSIDDGSGDDVEQMAYRRILTPAREKAVWTPRQQKIAIKSFPSYDRYRSALKKRVVNQ
jgi:hypothetical protein